MLLTGSLGRKVLVMLLATGGLIWVLEATMFDSQHGGRREATEPPPVDPASTFTATAYCRGKVTSEGITPQQGVAAADASVLPPGSIISVDTGGAGLGGLYTVLDTGPNMKGRRIDLYTWNCTDAVRFGRRAARVTVLRLGWSPDPRASGPLVTRPRGDVDTVAR